MFIVKKPWLYLIWQKHYEAAGPGNPDVLDLPNLTKDFMYVLK